VVEYGQNHEFTLEEIAVMNATAQNTFLGTGGVVAFRETLGTPSGTVVKWFANSPTNENLVPNRIATKTRMGLWDYEEDSVRQRLLTGMLLTGSVVRRPHFEGETVYEGYEYPNLAYAIERAFSILTRNPEDYFLSVAMFELTLTRVLGNWVLGVAYKKPVDDDYDSTEIGVAKHAYDRDARPEWIEKRGQELEEPPIVNGSL
jgi:hypothetical protein